MVRIQQIQQNYQPISNSRQKTVFANGQSFGNKKFEAPEELTKFLSKKVEAKTKINGFNNWLYNLLYDTQGEVQHTLLNAVFTSTLAPLMIAFNPFTNESSNNKKYMALRQPISAAIAVTITFGMTELYDHFIDSINNSGLIKSTDLRSNPDEEYLKGFFKRDYKKAKQEGRLEAFLRTCKPEMDVPSKNTFFARSSYKNSCFKGYVEQIQEKRQDLFAKLLSEDPKNISIKETANIPGLGTEKELRAYLDVHNFHNMTLGQLMKERFGFEFYKDGEFKPEATDVKLQKTKAMDFLRETGLIETDGKVTENELREFLAIHKEQELGLSKASNEGKRTSRLIQWTVGEEIGKAESISLGQFFHQLDYKTKDGSLQSLMDKKLAAALPELGNMFKGTMREFGNEAKLGTFAKNFVKTNAKRLGSYAKNSKTFTGIIFNLVSTAVSCTVLNWAYPRVVRTLWPSLVKDDEKGGHK